jgi:uncharacterized membrane protein YoaK (UPF0700 family)
MADAGAAGGASTAPGSTRDLLLIALTLASGGVDAVSYLGLGQIFTANMTGNLVFMAIAAGTGSLPTALRSADAFVGFAVGAILAGRVLGGVSERGRWTPRVTRVIAGELLVMGTFAVGWAFLNGRPTADGLYLLIALSSFGMGMQNAAARHMGVPGLTTTVVTTALTGIMAEFAALGISGSTHKRAAAAVIALFSGAAVGAALILWARSAAPFMTVVLLVAVVAAALTSFGRPAAPTPSPKG